MTTPLSLTWLALAVAIAVVPLGNPALVRVLTLTERGRLDAGLPGSDGPRAVSRHADTAVITVAVGCCVLVGVRCGLVLGFTALVVTGTVAKLARQALRARVAGRRAARLLSAVRLMVAELTAGSRPADALAAAASACPEYAATLAVASERARAGTDVAEPLESGELTTLAQAWRFAALTGAPLADVLARAADDLAAQEQLQRVVASALASPRSSALLLAVLPALGIALGSAMDADPLHFLITSGAGQWVALAGVVLDAAGLLWTQRLTARAQR